MESQLRKLLVLFSYEGEKAKKVVRMNEALGNQCMFGTYDSQTFVLHETECW